jgi:double-stranded uracil-DNA glycosylase
MGITNMAARPTARADELSDDELVEGGRILRDLVERAAPAWLAVVGMGAYRTAFGDRGAVVGAQEPTIGATRIWVLPNPSGLNAHYPKQRLVEEFARLRAAVR